MRHTLPGSTNASRSRPFIEGRPYSIITNFPAISTLLVARGFRCENATMLVKSVNTTRVAVLRMNPLIRMPPFCQGICELNCSITGDNAKASLPQVGIIACKPVVPDGRKNVVGQRVFQGDNRMLYV